MTRMWAQSNSSSESDGDYESSKNNSRPSSPTGLRSVVIRDRQNKVTPEFCEVPTEAKANPNSEESIGQVGIKLRVRIVRVYDSEEQWNGMVEIYFHWTSLQRPPPEVDKTIKTTPRRRSIAAMTITSGDNTQIIDPPPDHPIFLILNDETSHSTEEIYYTCTLTPFVLYGYKSFNVVVHERLELERFPFDRQFFKLEIECSNGEIIPWSVKTIPTFVRIRLDISDGLSPEECRYASSNFFGVSDTPSWSLDLVSVKQGARLSSATMSLGMSRLSGFYISNVVIPCFLIGAGAVLTCAIDSDDYANRFQCMIALFLTLVAIKFVANFLPVISYSTLLDIYTLVSYLFLASWMLENFVVAAFFSGDERAPLRSRIDQWAALTYITLWVSLHLVIFLGEKRDIFRKDWKSVIEDDQQTDPNAHKESVDFD